MDIKMAKDFNQPFIVDGYDEHIRKLIPGYELVHLQISALLKTYLPEQANILVVGCGTGYELRYLTQQFPQWHFTAIDPAENMLHKAKQLLQESGAADRVNFILGDTSVLIEIQSNSQSNCQPVQFDAALSILVSHFIDKPNKIHFFQDIYQVLKPQSFCLSYDLMQFEQKTDLTTLKYLAQSTGLSDQQSQVMIERLEQDFHLVSMAKMHQIYEKSGFTNIRTFTQMFTYYGFIAFKA